MIREAEARKLVESYIRTWHERWSSVQEQFEEEVDFDLWASLVDEVDKAHFRPGASSGSEQSCGFPPDHDPEEEKIVGFVPEEAGTARVETAREGIVPVYWEYEIVLAGGAPRLAKIRRFLHPKGTPVVDRADAERTLAAPSAKADLRPLPRGVDPAGDSVFQPGRVVTVGQEPHPIEVRTLGALATRTGALSVRDFAYDGHGLAALERRVPPGRYPVDVAIVATRVAALRVQLSEAPVAAWHPATFTSGGHVVGVDAANVAVFDVGSFVTLEAWQKERLFEEHVAEAPRPNARLITLREKNDCVIVETGAGDGAYPCYWGVDARGNIARLFVDFLLVASFLEETVSIPWTGGAIRHPLLDEWDVSVEIDGAVLVARGAAFERARLVRDGEPIADTTQLGVDVCDDERTHDLPEEVMPPLTIEITLATGYRNG